jgi:protein ImuB
VAGFAVQAAVRGEPGLRDCALALIDGKPPLWNVAAASGAALQMGIHLGMTRAQTAQFCNVQIRQRSESQEKAAHAALLDVAWSISPRVEDTALDRVVLDLTGLESLFGTQETIARELAKRASGIGLNPQIAVASNIEAAIHAARGFAGIAIIPDGEESQRLSKLPVEVLAANPETLEILERWGIHTFQELAALPVLQISERLGQEGVRLHQLARGTYVRSLILAQLSTSFEEEVELDDAVEELEPLSFVLGGMLDQLCARLEARSLAVRSIYLRFELEPSFEKEFLSLKDESRKKTAATEYSKALHLPVPMRDSKMLLKLLRLQLQTNPPAAAVQKITMTADWAAPRVVQGGLFTPAAPDAEKLELTMARLAKLVGEGNVGSPELVDSHGFENFRMSRFCGEIKNVPGERERSAIVNGFRVMRPAMAVKVEVHDEQPVRVIMGGARGNVTAASGPWRSSGEWWDGEAWNQDEWELAIDFSGSGGGGGESAVYRIYWDAMKQGWFVRGIYD